MNTFSFVIMILVIILFIFCFWSLIKAYRKTEDSYDKRNVLYVIIGSLLIFSLAILTTLNMFGIARIPVLNTVEKRSPEIYSPSPPINVPSNGPVQPSSEPAINEHKERMEKLKRDGF